MNPAELLRIARHLAVGGVGSRRGRPRQVELRRAVSAAYYAMFHTLARCCADLVVGVTRASRDQIAWEQTYRALEHGFARNQCDNRTAMARFPTEIQEFGKWFVEMQRHRHQADYAPDLILSRAQVMQFIDDTEAIIGRFNATSTRDRRGFATHVLLRLRRD